MADYPDQQKWITLERLTRRHGYFFGRPEILSRNGITTFSQGYLLYIVLLPFLFLFAMGVFTVVIPWMAKRPYSQQWIELLRQNKHLLLGIIVLGLLSAIYGWKTARQLLSKRKVVLTPERSEMEIYYGFCLFPQKLSLKPGHFTGVICEQVEYNLFKYKALTIQPVGMEDKRINLFSIADSRGLAAYERIMVFLTGRIPDDLVAEISLGRDGTRFFSKAPICQGGRFCPRLRFTFPSPDTIKFQRSIAEPVALTVVGLLMVLLGIYSLLSGLVKGLDFLFLAVSFAFLIYSLSDLFIGFKFRQVTVDKSLRMIRVVPTFPDSSIKSGSYSFDDIAAIQISVRRRRNKNNPKQTGQIEVNLVLSTGENERVTLAVIGDLPENYDKVKQLAESIDKPVIIHSLSSS